MRDRVGAAAPGAPNAAFPETVVTGLNGGLQESGAIQVAGRQAESALLHSKGGWRDHSDGNRITTTRGDKIEVIRGNYKLVVLGRQQTLSINLPDRNQAQVAEAAGVDMSGGLVDTDSGDLAAPGVTALDITYNWQQDSDGSWAWTQTTNVGAELPDPAGNSNYQIVNRSWLDYQRSQTGSERRRVSFLGQETYADILWSYTNVTGTNNTVTRGKELLTLTTAPAINDITNAALATEARVVPVGLEVDLSDIIAQVAVAVFTNNWVGVVFDNHVGLHSDVHAGAHLEARVGLHLDNHALLHAETHLGQHTDIHLAPHLELHNEHFTLETTLIEIQKGVISLNGSSTWIHTGPHTIIGLEAMPCRTSVTLAMEMAAAHNLL